MGKYRIDAQVSLVAPDEAQELHLVVSQRHNPSDLAYARNIDAFYRSVSASLVE